MSKSLLTRTPTSMPRSVFESVLVPAPALTSVKMSVLERMFALALIFVSARAEPPMPPATPENLSVFAWRPWRELPARAREPKLCERRFLERDGRQVALKSMSATPRRAPRAMLVRVPGVPMPLLRP
jgi:hypothetical protein